MEVIIVDDDPVVICLHQFYVKHSKLSTEPLAFLNAQEALNYLDTRIHFNKPHLLLLDINMPQMSGWEFLDAINVRPYSKKIFVVIVSSSVDASDHQKAKAYGQVIGYLEKPIDSNSLQDFKYLTNFGIEK